MKIGSILEYMTEQQVFDSAARVLLSMDGPSVNQSSGNCAYRENPSSEAKCCAAGVFVSDEEYEAKHEIIEGRNWGMLVGAEIACSAHSGIVVALQKIHDNTVGNVNWGNVNWPVAIRLRLREMAVRQHFDTTILDEDSACSTQ